MTTQKTETYCEAEFENIEKILLQIQALQRENYSYSLTEIAALSTFLHNVYNGMENILKRILIFLELRISKTSTWHKDLLVTAQHHKIISEDLFKSLLGYLSFRHYFVHSYVFKMEWESLRPLVEEINFVYENFKLEVQTFLLNPPHEY